jgi:hypothetical protein
MSTSGKGTVTVGSNVQIAVDADHHLIVARQVINHGTPPPAWVQGAAGYGAADHRLADRGYFSGDQVLACEGTGVGPIVPKTLTSYQALGE